MQRFVPGNEAHFLFADAHAKLPAERLSSRDGAVTAI
jgi:prepilin-type processing-associated H-X9-DG protein